MDFGHFGDGPQTTGNENTTTPGNLDGNTANTPGASASGGQAEQPLFMHTMEHPGVTCDICNGKIRGFRYKCMECVDYDLCTACERKGNHPGHVCMRIAFPEQAGGAFRKFLGSAVGCGAGRRPGGPFGGLGFPFEAVYGHGGHHRGHRERPERGCHRRGSAAGNGSARDSDGDSGPEEPKAPNDCPYGLGRKGMKKWGKYMKKMANQQRRSAETYAKSAAQAAGATCATAAGLAGAPVQDGQGGTEAQQFDFTAAASQIQEFLNAFGIPIDVVELYDNFGNRGQPRTEGGNSPTSPEGASGGESTKVPSNEQSVPPQAPIGFEGATNAIPTNLAAHMQQLHLNGSNQGVTATANETSVTPAVPSAPLDSSAAQVAVIMDLDADSSGWTLLDTERAPNAAPASGEQNGMTSEPSSVNFGLVGPPLASIITPLVPNENGNGVTENNGNVPPPTPTGTTPGGRLYPGLHNQPQLQQLFSGVTQAMNSMVRNIPIVTNPSGPPSGNVSGPPSGNGSQLDVRCTVALNQLLSMGFSNHDGWLSRLVVAKNGDLEAVLNSLFPVGQ